MSELARKVDLTSASLSDLRRAQTDAESRLADRRKKLALAEQAITWMGAAAPAPALAEIDACRRAVEAGELEIAGLKSAVEAAQHQEHAHFERTDAWR